MIDDKMAEIRCRYPKSDIIEEQRKNQLARTFQDRIEIQEFLNYNIRIEQFWADYEDFLEGCAQRLDWLQRLKKLELFLVNSGSCPATDIDITIHLTDCVELYKDGELPKLPVKPTPPIYPRSENEADLLSRWNLDSAFLKDISTALSLPMPKSFRTSFSNVSPVKISHTDSYELHVNVQGLKHHFKESICEFYIAYPSWDAVKSFEIDYLLIASNVPQKVAGTLNVKVEVEEANRAGN
jgi:hypothetical protein